MIIQFADISPQGSRYEVLDCSWFPDQEVKRCGGIEAVVMATRKSADKVALEGYLKTTVELICDRCGERYRRDIDTELILVLEYLHAESWSLRDLESRIEDLDLVEVRTPEVDLGDILRQQLYLALPHKSLCRADCRGLCPGCGIDLNKEACRCPAGSADSPFAVLAKLRK